MLMCQTPPLPVLSLKFLFQYQITTKNSYLWIFTKFPWRFLTNAGEVSQKTKTIPFSSLHSNSWIPYIKIKEQISLSWILIWETTYFWFWCFVKLAKYLWTITWIYSETKYHLWQKFEIVFHNIKFRGYLNKILYLIKSTLISLIKLLM